MGNRININQFYRGLDQLFAQKNPQETCRYMMEWLKEARHEDDLSAVVAISNELGGFYRATGELARAKELYDDALRILENMGMTASEHYATTLINAGDVYVYAKQWKEALGAFLRAKSILDRCGMDGDYRMAALCNNISMVYRENGEFAEAEQALDIAFNIIKGIPQYRGELGVTYINLGGLQAKQGKLEMAEQSYREACKIFDADGGGNVHYPQALAGLGEVYYHKGRLTEAEEYYVQALKFVERDFGKTRISEGIATNLEKIRQEKRMV